MTEPDRMPRGEVHYPDARREPMNAPADRLLRRLQLDGAAPGVCGALLP
jgi:hypothetical protein